MENKEQIYYKVIRSMSRKSCIVRDSAAVCYELNKWVKPNVPNSKLMVFKERTDAEKFVYDPYDIRGAELKIVKCLIKNPCYKDDYRVLRDISISTDYIRIFWDCNPILQTNWEKHCLYSVTKPVPEGTVFCDEVYCLE